MQLVNAYIVGAQKAGTTSLYYWLSQHTEVFAPAELKDFPLFSGDDARFERRMKRARKLYQSREAQACKVRLGAEANLVFSKMGVRRLGAAFPDCKILFLIRRPDERCFSAWRYARERGLEERNFAEAINQELMGQQFSRDSREGRQMNYIQHSLYTTQLSELRQHFGDKKIKVLPFEFLKEHPDAFMELVSTHLGLQSEFSWSYHTENRTTGGSKSKLLSKLLYGTPTGAPFALMRLLIPSAVRARLRARLVSWNRNVEGSDPAQPNEHTLRRIRSVLLDDTLFHEEIMRDVKSHVKRTSLA